MGKRMILFLLVAIFLTGCMYPQERRMENIPVDQSVKMVQEAVEQFQEETTVLPIETRPADTPVYEKYIIDFGKLVPRYIPFVPTNAFENGGIYKYVLVDVETEPKVKLLNLYLLNEINDIQRRVNLYKYKTTALPVKSMIDKNYFTIDFSQLNRKAPEIKSPFTSNFLPVIMDINGKVGIDYSMDLMIKLKEVVQLPPDGEDIRDLLVNDSYFVPVASFEYTLKNNEPVFLFKDEGNQLR
ncbi:hypothetical protein L1765_05975 [Microaerobacter geothermalis]|uniref:hypothetical protein n=1 Tax=Microaerobacter geothermalis TaxID=674972 RepID=UPI001F2362FA|nr:hypothetical protein [Microaerobacter geothermalis]MCF6093534.1 hypothetical protein [Microaerobacter geothermalis]